MYVNTAEESCI